MLTAKICTEMFQKIIKTKPQQYTKEDGNEVLIYRLQDYELFVEISADFRVQYLVNMVVEYDPHHVSKGTM